MRDNLGLVYKSKGFVKWKCLVYLENVRLFRVEKKDFNKIFIKEVGFVIRIFFGFFKIIFLSS